MRGVMSLSKNQITWTIFICLLFLFPAIFYLIFGFFISPLFPLIIATIVHILEGAIELFRMLFVIFYCSVWVGLYYFVSVSLSNKISKYDVRYRSFLLLGVIFIIILSGFLPINTHMVRNSSTAYEMYVIHIRDIHRLNQNE
jgi:hypothetical protein